MQNICTAEGQLYVLLMSVRFVTHFTSILLEIRFFGFVDFVDCKHGLFGFFFLKKHWKKIHEICRNMNQNVTDNFGLLFRRPQ